MIVLKFGGSSVGTSESLRQVKKIIDSHKNKESVIVVVSALSGITDTLYNTSSLAAEGDKTYLDHYEKMVNRHYEIIDELVIEHKKKTVKNLLQSHFVDLANIFRGIYLIRDISMRITDTIVAYGEILSSILISGIIEDSVHFDARNFIKTTQQFNKHIVDFKSTEKEIQTVFKKVPQISICGGFISTDVETGYTTNIGRGGSDYTAAILAATLNATQLEIWTDVDGFMTADPRTISTAYVIDNLSFSEAMELSNFGAKVIYPPTIFPVYQKNIPVLIKNTFNPNAKGTRISNDKQENNQREIKGISSINDTSLITIQGLGMVGVIGVNRRIFKVLAQNGISVFLVAQASSENTTSIGVRNEDSQLALEVLSEEFKVEIEQGDINRIVSNDELVTIAVVGDNMKRKPGIAGKLFGTLGKNGINVIACAQGASETNISFVTHRSVVRKALNVIHDSFFLSEYQALNLFVVGVGTVGASLLEQIRCQQIKLMKNNRLKIKVVGVCSSKKMLIDRKGIELEGCLDKLREEGKTGNANLFLDEIIKQNIFNSVFVDCTASNDVSELYQVVLENNISVVTANKVAASSAYQHYLKLKNTARERDIKFLFETNVGAGLPIINTMNNLTNSGDRILKLEAVLSGTLNYIFNTLSADIPLSKAIQMAKEEGFSEPDPRIDLSGIDVIRKLVILTREAGYAVEQEEIKKDLFVPSEYFEGTLNDFWKNIKNLDSKFETERQQLVANKERWRFVAKMEEGECSVGLQTVDSSHPFYELQGSNNIILITTERYNEYPMIIKGYGAGANVTAAGVFADIMSIANI